MRILVVTLDLAEAERRFEQRGLASPALELSPAFLAASARWLEDNSEVAERAGFVRPRVEPCYLSFRDTLDVEHYVPLLKLRHGRGCVNMLPAASVADAVLSSDPVDTALLGQVQGTLTGPGHQLYIKDQDPGWDLTPSLLGLLGSFSVPQRGHVAHCELDVSLEIVDYRGRARQRALAFQRSSHARKAQADITLMTRDLDVIHALFPSQLRLAEVRCSGELVGCLLWTEHADRAALLEWSGDTTFGKDSVLPTIFFQLLTLLKQRGLRCLYYMLWDWFCPPLWTVLLRQDFADAAVQQRLMRHWQRLEGRGMQELRS